MAGAVVSRVRPDTVECRASVVRSERNLIDEPAALARPACDAHASGSAVHACEAASAIVHAGLTGTVTY